MIAKLTGEQRQALEEQSDTPVRIVDPRTNATYVLLRSDVFDRMKQLCDDREFDIQEAYPLMDEAARGAGWDDPEMDIYNDLDPRKQT